MKNLSPVTLENQFVRLEPLRESHLDALWEVGQNPRVWEHFWLQCRQPSDMARYIERYLELQNAGQTLPFAIWSQSENRFVGSTVLLDYGPARRTVEIGSTWLTPDVWGSPINFAAKLLLLTHCFESLDLVRVSLKTDNRNLRSQRAMEKLGAKREGVFRKHMQRPDGTWRDSVWFSIIDEEWPVVKGDLEARLPVSR